MKQSLIFAAAIAAFSLSTLSAQTFTSVRVHFDQAVQAGSKALPAGDYSITMIRSNGDIPMLRFSSDNGDNAVVLASRVQHAGGETASHTDVVLDTAGSVERVARIEVEGSDTDYVLPLNTR